VVGGANANFSVTGVKGCWSITRARVTATAGSYSGTYDGSAHSPTACVVTGAFTTGVTCTNSPASVGPGVGSGTVTPVASDTTNFSVTPVNGAWSITPAPVTATAGSYSSTYRSEERRVAKYAVTGAYTTGVSDKNSPASVG